MRSLIATLTLTGLLSMLVLSSDAQAFGHKKKAECAPAPVVYCPPPAPVVYCPPPPPPVVYCPPPPPCPPEPCYVPCETPKKKCGLFGGGGLFGKKKAVACAPPAPVHHAPPVSYAPVSYAAPACCN